MDKATWLSMGAMMPANFPDIEYIIEDVREAGGGVQITGTFIGTFRNDFDLTRLGFRVVPATGEKVTWPSITSQVTIEVRKNHQFSRLEYRP